MGARRAVAAAPAPREVSIPLPGSAVGLGGTLARPAEAGALVVFAHGSGSSRFSPRNRQVAAALNAHGLGTLLMDLLTRDEEALDAVTAELRFDIPRLAQRLVGAIDWVLEAGIARPARVGLFGASTGAAAALIAAAERPAEVAAVVSRGGRPDLAGAALPRVRCPVLLIVGGRDDVVLRLNESAAARLQCPHRLLVVPGATHLFEERGALEQVAEQSADWFERHLVPPGEAPP